MPQKLEGGRRFHSPSVEAQPLISIISVVFQARHQLQPLLNSVIHLRDDRTEVIVIDGGSNDGTHELLAAYDSQIDYWLSEPDDGIYDAMNKGLRSARGSFVLHLNAGDRLLYLPVEELETAARQHVDVAAFQVSIDGEYNFRPSCGKQLRFNNTLHHQGTFFRRERLSGYNTAYRVYGDFDMNQKLVAQGAKVAIYNHVVAFHSTDGISNISDPSVVSEFFRVIRSNQGWVSVPIAWVLCKIRGLKTRVRKLRFRSNRAPAQSGH